MPGCDGLIARVDGLLRAGQNVLLFGLAGVGKTALMAALPPRACQLLDPFEHVSSRLAARIRRAIDRRVLHLAATRSLDRRHLGAVRRIAFWFTPVAVPPLPPRWMRRIVRRESLLARLPEDAVPAVWIQATVRLSAGRPGVAVGIVRAAARRYAATGTLPSPAAAYIQARVPPSGLIACADETPR